MSARVAALVCAETGVEIAQPLLLQKRITGARMHAEMWAERLRDEQAFRDAVDELWPYALGVLREDQRPLLCDAVGRNEVEAIERGEHTEDLRPLWEEMTMVRRSVPGASW